MIRTLVSQQPSGTGYMLNNSGITLTFIMNTAVQIYYGNIPEMRVFCLLFVTYSKTSIGAFQSVIKIKLKYNVAKYRKMES